MACALGRPRRVDHGAKTLSWVTLLPTKPDLAIGAIVRAASLPADAKFVESEELQCLEEWNI